MVFWHGVGLSGRFEVLQAQDWCPGTMYGCQDATVTLLCGVDVPIMVRWHDLGRPGHNRHVGSLRRRPRNCVLARMGIIGRLSSGAAPAVKLDSCRDL
eukprot:6061152-Pyramimonas_sp.AAC.1